MCNTSTTRPSHSRRDKSIPISAKIHCEDELRRRKKKRSNPNPHRTLFFLISRSGRPHHHHHHHLYDHNHNKTVNRNKNTVLKGTVKNKTKNVTDSMIVPRRTTKKSGHAHRTHLAQGQAKDGPLNPPSPLLLPPP